MAIRRMERRGYGRIVDLRISLSKPPDNAVHALINQILRYSDAVLSVEGREVAVALGSTTAEQIEEIVVPRLRRQIEREGYRVKFVVNGKRV